MNKTRDVCLFHVQKTVPLLKTKGYGQDSNFDEEKATGLFFDSDTYNKLTDPQTGLYQKGWIDTLKLLLEELKL